MAELQEGRVRKKDGEGRENTKETPKKRARDMETNEGRGIKKVVIMKSRERKGCF